MLKCIDCGILITKGAKRCMSCGMKKRLQPLPDKPEIKYNLPQTCPFCGSRISGGGNKMVYYNCGSHIWIENNETGLHIRGHGDCNISNVVRIDKPEQGVRKAERDICWKVEEAIHTLHLSADGVRFQDDILKIIRTEKLAVLDEVMKQLNMGAEIGQFLWYDNDDKHNAKKVLTTLKEEINNDELPKGGKKEL